jgi:hypothetical protein
LLLNPVQVQGLLQERMHVHGVEFRSGGALPQRLE